MKTTRIREKIKNWRPTTKHCRNSGVHQQHDAPRYHQPATWQRKLSKDKDIVNARYIKPIRAFSPVATTSANGPPVPRFPRTAQSGSREHHHLVDSEGNFHDQRK